MNPLLQIPTTTDSTLVVTEKTLSVIELITSGGIGGGLVMGALGILSVFAIYILIERFSVIKKAKKEGKILIKDSIADITLQQVLTRPEEFDVIATMNLNGDYLSDALAAQVGGIGIAPGGNINFDTGHAIFEATHGTAPKYANQDKVNPGSLLLSGEMMKKNCWRIK